MRSVAQVSTRRESMPVTHYHLSEAKFTSQRKWNTVCKRTRHGTLHWLPATSALTLFVCLSITESQPIQISFRPSGTNTVLAQPTTLLEVTMATSTSTTIPSGFANLLETGKYSDLTITCGERTWKVHKNVLCTQSDFFAKACDGQFRVCHLAQARHG